jgi:hypothetical protein
VCVCVCVCVLCVCVQLLGLSHTAAVCTGAGAAMGKIEGLLVGQKGVCVCVSVVAKALRSYARSAVWRGMRVVAPEARRRVLPSA